MVRRDAVVVQEPGDRLLFQGRIGKFCVAAFLGALHDAIDVYEHRELVLDFSRIDRAYPHAMVPMICAVEARRDHGVEFGAELPRDGMLRRLFLNTNWAHFLHPERYERTESTIGHQMPVRRYVDSQQQQAVVNAVMDIVMGNMELDRDVITGLEWSINEITDNVLVHAESPHGGLVQVSTFRERQKIEFVVADSGRGILESMREGFPNLRSDEQGIAEAIKQGVTRNPEIGQGNGLAGTLRIATGSGGSFGVASGTSALAVIKPPKAHDYEERTYSRRQYRGTVVDAELSTTEPLSLDAILGGDEPITHAGWDVIDAQYVEGEVMVLRLADQTPGFGTRQAGAAIRTKCQNLLRSEPDKRLLLDWAGIPLVSSSFADEAIGRLFVEMGPIEFGARVQNVGMEQLVRSLVDRAVVQRVGQATGGSL